MGEPLVSVVCTTEAPPPTLSSILSAAYEKETDCEPALILLSTNSKSEWEKYTLDSASQPDAISPFVSPFSGMTAKDIARHLHENAEGTVLSPRYFFIADERTAKDSTFLLVQVDWDNPEILETVRVAGEVANAEAVSLAIGTSGLEELISLVDEDGVYRGEDED